MNKCEGIVSALMTPFTKEGKLDENVLRKYVRHNIDRMKVDGLYVGGSTGEGLLMSKEERIAVLEITKEEAANKIGLIAHIGSLELDAACEMAQNAEELGYDLISAVLPYYYPFKFPAVKKYYETILNATKNVGLVLYYIPVLTKAEISVDNFAELFENKRVVGIKYTDADVFTLERIIKKYPGKTLWAGFDEMFIAYAAYGLRSGIGSTYNIQAPIIKSIAEAMNNKDLDKALELQHKANDVISTLLKVGIYPALKEVVTYFDPTAVAYCRAPMMASVKDEDKKVLKDMFEKYLSNF